MENYKNFKRVNCQEKIRLTEEGGEQMQRNGSEEREERNSGLQHRRKKILNIEGQG